MAGKVRTKVIVFVAHFPVSSRVGVPVSYRLDPPVQCPGFTDGGCKRKTKGGEHHIEVVSNSVFAVSELLTA